MRPFSSSIFAPSREWMAPGSAIAIHLLLLVFLWIGVQWQNTPPVALEAEIWSAPPSSFAPKIPAELSRELPKSRLLRSPTPAVLPRSVHQPVREQIEEPTPLKQDIVLEQKTLPKKLKMHRRISLPLQNDIAQKSASKALKPPATEKKPSVRPQKKIKAATMPEVPEKMQTVAPSVKMLLALPDKKDLQKHQQKQQAEQVRQEQKMKQAREEEMRRLTGDVSSSAASGKGVAQVAAEGRAVDLGYAQKVAAKIKSNTVFIASERELNADIAVEYELELLPDGSIKTAHKIKSSGVAGFDEAVLRGIEKSQPYPADRSGHVPSNFALSYKLKESLP